MKSLTKKQQILQDEWEALLKKHSKPLEQGAIAKGVKTYKLKPTKVEKNQEALEKIRSLVTPGGSTAKPAPKVYTGDKILGIATMHKSNMVPIFNEQAAVDVATMRRS